MSRPRISDERLAKLKGVWEDGTLQRKLVIDLLEARARIAELEAALRLLRDAALIVEAVPGDADLRDAQRACAKARLATRIVDE